MKHSHNLWLLFAVNKKHYPPSPSDEVWRLENIRKYGPYHKRLIEENINTVNDFLTQYSLNHERLQEVRIHLLFPHMLYVRLRSLANCM